jgi:hypothetical protein
MRGVEIILAQVGETDVDETCAEAARIQSNNAA